MQKISIIHNFFHFQVGSLTHIYRSMYVLRRCNIPKLLFILQILIEWGFYIKSHRVFRSGPVQKSQILIMSTLKITNVGKTSKLCN